MKPQRLLALGLGISALVAASPAFAHPGHGAATFSAGLLHPLTGLDHVLAMFAVGLLAARRGGKAILLWPMTFVCAMLVGYTVGLRHLANVPVEPAILASVLVLGSLTASSISTPFGAGLGLIALFGAFHGFAHGSEAPIGAGPGFPIGFAISTVALHGAGLALGLAALRAQRPAFLRLSGGAVALAGAVLAVAG